MTREEKIQNILENRYGRSERPYAAAYLWALYRNNEIVIADFERFGDRPKSIFFNRHTYECALRFGFTEIAFDDCGWLVKPTWLDFEEISFQHNEKFTWNKIEIGRGPNGKWTNSVSYSLGVAGGSCGIHVYGQVYNSRKDAVVSGLNELLEIHAKGKATAKKENDTVNFKADYSAKIVSQVKDYLSNIINPQPVQISIFDI